MEKGKPLVQWTIRELVAVLSVGTVVFGAIWAGEIVSQLVILLTMLIVMGWLIIAVVGQGEWRTFALGCTIVSLAFGGTLIVIESKIIRAEDGSAYELPTAALWGQFRSAISRNEFYLKGKLMPNSADLVLTPNGIVQDPAGNSVGTIYANDGYSGIFGGGGGAPKPTPNLPHVFLKVVPDGGVFYTCGHVFWLLLLSYLGGKFAVGFVRFQDRQEEIAAPNG